MAISCSKQRISTHKKTQSGSTQPTASLPRGTRGGGKTDDLLLAGGGNVGATVEGMGMYSFVVKDGSRKYAFTRHCSESEADKIEASHNT